MKPQAESADITHDKDFQFLSSYLCSANPASTQVRFSQDERVYKAFLEILNMYRKGQKTIVQVYEEVGGLVRLCTAN